MIVCSSTVTTRPVRSAAGDDGGDVERLERRHVEDVGVDALRPASSSAASTTRGVCAPVLMRVTSRPSRTTTATPGSKRYALVEQALRRVADEPDVDRALVAGRPAQDEVRLDVVGRRHGDHARHRPHDRDVVDDLVGLAGAAGEQARIARGDLHVQAGLGDEDPDLIERADDGEGDESADERDQPDARQAGGDAEHVLLGDAHLQVAVRVGQLEDVGLGRHAEVAVEHHDPRVRASASAVTVSPKTSRMARPIGSVIEEPPPASGRPALGRHRARASRARTRRRWGPRVCQS